MVPIILENSSSIHLSWCTFTYDHSRVASYGITYLPLDLADSSLTCAICSVKLTLDKATAGFLDCNGHQAFACVSHFSEVDNLGIPPKKQKRPNWTKGPVSRLLINETYTGKHYYYKKEAIIPKNPMASSTKRYKQRHTNKTSRKPRDRSEWLLVKAPRIIDDDLFERAQKQLALNSKYNPRNKVHPYLLSGLIYCACGERRVGDGPAKAKVWGISF